jgi:15-cis-phytoene synthase
VSRDTSFYYSFLVLPAAQRDAIVAVWDFCRAIDDEVDEPGPGSPQAALEAWRAEVARCYEGTPETPQGRRLQPFIGRFHLPRRPFEDLIDGVEMDLTRSRYETFEDLYEYCWRVASTVGLICIEIFGCRQPVAREYAVALGIALQLTNIVRDVASDLARGRVYLPQADLTRFGCSERDLRAGKVTPTVRALLEFECRRAREYYRKADQLLPPEDRRALVAARIMGAIYHATLERIERSGYDVFSQTVRLPRPRRAAIAAFTRARSLVS